jgi:hypothetical protein
MEAPSTSETLVNFYQTIQRNISETAVFDVKKFSHLRLGLKNGLFPSGFQIKILYAFLISPTRAPPFSFSVLIERETVIFRNNKLKLKFLGKRNPSYHEITQQTK